MTIRIAIAGFGKIARDQHLPAIAADPHFELVAIATSHGHPGLDLPWFATADQLLDAMEGRIDAVAICTPPQVRHAIARRALSAGLSVLLEKPPAATLGEIEDLERRAARAGRALYAAWHSQHAAAVPKAAELLADAKIRRMDISWFEDVRKWHPGQEWIWMPGGFGVFDPGINALSIATRILPMPLLVQEARLLVPANHQAPIAAELAFTGGEFRAAFDWRYSEGERWEIRIETGDGRVVVLEDGGAQLSVDGIRQSLPECGEYASIYARFAEVVRNREVAVDREPQRIVADAFLVGRRELVEPFE